MLLAVDIGNTNIALGVFKGKRLLKRYAIATKATAYLNQLKKIIFKNKIDEVIICSVVPLATKKIDKDLRKILGKRHKIIGRDIKAPVRNLYRKPEQVGQDRLVNAYAVVKLYSCPAIIVDFGTAITFDVVSKNNEYLGGMILPGLEISLACLAERAALLPRVKLDFPRELIGRDTRNSILSGIVHGFACLTDNLIEKIKSGIGKKVKVIGTGGNIDLISRYCQGFDIIDKDLTLKGLNLIDMEQSR